MPNFVKELKVKVGFQWRGAGQKAPPRAFRTQNPVGNRVKQIICKCCDFFQEKVSRL